MIVLKHILTSENFSLVLQLRIFQADIAFSSNAIMNVTVESYGFCANAELDIDIKEFAKFAADLQKIYNLLSGTAQIREPYGINRFIEFFGDGKGHIFVTGFISQNVNGFSHEFKFNNEIDQTQLKEFAKELCEKYSIYNDV